MDTQYSIFHRLDVVDFVIHPNLVLIPGFNEVSSFLQEMDESSDTVNAGSSACLMLGHKRKEVLRMEKK